MRHMGITKKEIVISNPSRDFRVRATVDRRVFPKYIVVADFQMSRFSDVLEILRFTANHGKREKFVIVANFAGALDHDMRVKNTSIAELYPRPDHAVGSNREVDTKFGIRRNNGSRMNHENGMIDSLFLIIP